MSRHPDRFRDKRLRRDIRIERPGLSERSISGSYRTGPTRFRDRPEPDHGLRRVLRLRDTPARIKNLLFMSNPNDRIMNSPLGPILGIVLAAVLAAGLPTEAAGKSPDARLCTLPVNSIRAVREYFRYRGPSDMPIVSGHRGCREDGCPENSIRAFEHTLRRVPAFFEIDPRMTRDSVVVLMHDPTLDRTTTGHGPVSEHTWAELRELRLKDVHGNVTDERIPTLEEAIRWSAGKTVVNLDVYTPKEVLGPLLERLGFPPHVMLTIHTPEQAEYYYALSRKTMFSIHIKSLEQLEAFEKTPIDWRNVMAYVGPRMLPENRELYERLRAKGVRCMISLAPTYDRRETPEQRREGYLSDRDILPDVIESDYPIELTRALQSLLGEERP